MVYELKTAEFKGQKITVKTNIGTLKEVWNILKIVNLDSLLTGGTLELSFNEIVDSLLSEGALDSICSVITSDLCASIDELDFNDIVGIISLFFTSIARPFQGLNISMVSQSRSSTPPVPEQAQQ
jgi:hypothetical protein